VQMTRTGVRFAMYKISRIALECQNTAWMNLRGINASLAVNWKL